jgi:hypothetical protein
MPYLHLSSLPPKQSSIISRFKMLFLIQFYDEWKDFRLAELVSLMELYGISQQGRFPSIPTTPADFPAIGTFIFVDLPSRDIATLICKRSVLINRVVEIWAHSVNSFAELCSEASSIWSSHLFREMRYEETFKLCSWSLLIESFNKAISYDDKEAYRKDLRCFTNHLQGPVRVSDPELTMALLLDFSYERAMSLDASIEGDVKAPIPTYFGRQVARGGMREALK